MTTTAERDRTGINTWAFVDIAGVRVAWQVRPVRQQKPAEGDGFLAVGVVAIAAEHTNVPAEICFGARAAIFAQPLNPTWGSPASDLVWPMRQGSPPVRLRYDEHTGSGETWWAAIEAVRTRIRGDLQALRAAVAHRTRLYHEADGVEFVAELALLPDQGNPEPDPVEGLPFFAFAARFS